MSLAPRVPGAIGPHFDAGAVAAAAGAEVPVCGAVAVPPAGTAAGPDVPAPVDANADGDRADDGAATVAEGGLSPDPAGPVAAAAPDVTTADASLSPSSFVGWMASATRPATTSTATAAEPRSNDEARRTQEARRAAEEGRVYGSPAAAAQAADDEAARQRAMDAAATHDTQVIPVGQAPGRPAGADDRPHLIPGFDRDEEETTALVSDPDATAEVSDPDATTVIADPNRSDSDRTQVLPASGAVPVDETQVIPDDVPTDPRPPSRRPSTRRRR